MVDLTNELIIAKPHCLIMFCVNINIYPINTLHVPHKPFRILHLWTLQVFDSSTVNQCVKRLHKHTHTPHWNQLMFSVVSCRPVNSISLNASLNLTLPISVLVILGLFYYSAICFSPKTAAIVPILTLFLWLVQGCVNIVQCRDVD